uniref:Uncharacterized protein n=1 Tax=Glossina pallidipes TaxID=7398 RepID=A0A1B0A4D3_GLOPL
MLQLTWEDGNASMLLQELRLFLINILTTSLPATFAVVTLRAKFWPKQFLCNKNNPGSNYYFELELSMIE